MPATPHLPYTLIHFSNAFSLSRASWETLSESKVLMMNLECESLSSAGLDHLKEVDEILRTESQSESDAQSDHSDSEFRSQELVIIVG